jgi:hypothetical protein
MVGLKVPFVLNEGGGAMWIPPLTDNALTESQIGATKRWSKLS